MRKSGSSRSLAYDRRTRCGVSDAREASTQGRAAMICGAGTSAYAASAVAATWMNATAIPTTDLLTYSKQDLFRLAPAFVSNGVLVSIARSGNSPESVGVIKRIKQMFPGVLNLAITCNEKGEMARLPGMNALVLDPRTNDRSLVMTSSFSNLLAGGDADCAAGSVEGELAWHCRRT